MIVQVSNHSTPLGERVEEGIKRKVFQYDYDSLNAVRPELLSAWYRVRLHTGHQNGFRALLNFFTEPGRALPVSQVGDLTCGQKRDRNRVDLRKIVFFGIN